MSASSCTPPESVKTALAPLISRWNGRYPSGSMGRMVFDDTRSSHMPYDASFSFVRGCTGNTTGRGHDATPSRIAESTALSSVFSALCTVSTTYSRGMSPLSAASIRSMLFFNVSIMMFPTRNILFREMPSLMRLSTAFSVGANRICDTRSTSTLFISSGMRMSNERYPDSICATGMCSFTSPRAAASVEFTSPTTITRS